jgi:galactose mutarotase-like enzyme
MVSELKNDKISIKVNSQGAELTSVVKSGKEYIWQADPKFWPRYTPVLFPIAGKLFENIYLHQGKKYQLSQHGFARDLEFKLLEQQNERLVYQLTENEETFKAFPFRFIFQIIYEIKEDILEIGYSVKNPARDTLFFSVGAHPGFNCPLEPNSTLEDYFLEFQQEENLEKLSLKDGLFYPEKKLVKIGKTLELTEELFAQDALFFDNLKSETVVLKSNKSESAVEMNFKGFPVLGIWKKKNARFLCIEPWYGIGDSAAGSTEISEKKGILSLKGQKEFNTSYSIRFH